MDKSTPSTCGCDFLVAGKLLSAARGCSGAGGGGEGTAPVCGSGPRGARAAALRARFAIVFSCVEAGVTLNHELSVIASRSAC